MSIHYKWKMNGNKKIIIIISRSILSQLQYQLFISIFWSMIWGIKVDVVLALDCWLSDLMVEEMIWVEMSGLIGFIILKMIEFVIKKVLYKKVNKDGWKCQFFQISISKLAQCWILTIEINSCHRFRPNYATFND